MDEAKTFCQQRRITRDAKVVNQPDQWPVKFKQEDLVIPLNSFFQLENWKEIYERMPASG
jgi:hypothetical protein